MLVARGLGRTFTSRAGSQEALVGVGFDVERGRTIAIVGESGAGKSTLARLLCGLDRPSAGSVSLGDAPVRPAAGRPSPVQLVFQDPVDALNGRRTVRASLTEPMRRLPRAERSGRAARLMEDVGLDPRRLGDRPRAFSGGQLQRIVIARALAGEPAVLVCDEPTSALDVSVQAQIINLLLELQAERDLAYVLITHDLGVARAMADDVLVLRDGRVEEHTPAADFFAGPRSAYAAGLVEAATG